MSTTIYHVFRRHVKSGNKLVWRYHYWFEDVQTGKRIIRVCKNCTTRYAAELYVQALNEKHNSKKIKDIAQSMFLPGSDHVKRRQQLGKTIKKETLKESRRFIEHIIDQFGQCDIMDLTPKMVVNYLFDVRRSASWKNQFTAALHEIFKEANFCGIKVQKLEIPRFSGKTKKSDIFTDFELQKLLKSENFDNYSAFMLFLLTAGAGLRISEARGFRGCQYLRNQKMIIVDGFMNRENTIRNNYNKTGNDDNPRWRVSIVQNYAVDALENFLNTQNCEISANSGKAGADAVVFKYNGAPFRVEYLRRLFTRAIKRAGIEAKGRKLTMHSLRYTYVTQMRTVLSGEIVQKMVGHTSIEMTNYYNRPDLLMAIETLKPAVKKLSEN